MHTKKFIKLSNLFTIMALFCCLYGCTNLCVVPSSLDIQEAKFRVVSDPRSEIYISRTDLNRDFSPSFVVGRRSEGKNEVFNGRSLTGSIVCRRVDGKDMSDDIKVIKISLKLENEMWETTEVKSEIYAPEPDYLTVSFRNGPMWGPASNLDINMLYKDKDGNEFTIVINNQRIDRSS